MTKDTTASPAALNDPTELDRFLAAYRPTGVTESTWLTVAPNAAALVRRAGPLTRRRLEQDIATLGVVVSHLIDRGRRVTLDEVLSDTTLQSFETALLAAGGSERTREKRRGVLRRLQAAHRGLPWREQRRRDGERTESLVSYTAVADLARVISAAQASTGTDSDADPFLAAVAQARAERAGETPPEPQEPGDWARARRFAQGHGLPLTKLVLRAIVTHEILAHDDAATVLIRRHHLTRRDLDLALTRVPALPQVPEGVDHALLRGTPGTTAVV